MSPKVDSVFKMKIVLCFALILLFNVRTTAQEAKPKPTPEEAQKMRNDIETYYANTTFKIKNYEGVYVAEKKFTALDPVEEMEAIKVFFENRKLTKGEITEKLKKGGPETEEITLPKIDENNVIMVRNGFYQTADLTEKPTYPGGMPEFYKFCGHFYKVPSTPTGIVIKGTIRVTFIVQKDGSLTDMQIVKDLGYGTGEEALRVLRLSQKWIPGKLNGQVVAAKFHLPISIQEPD
ncbi:energy transducer TonB [Flavobacterium mesophilum]|uniref:energy transducer TonB n=1 Tax=Flavobacterium mesophilum TaxID=3143495 RepID=UPI0031CF25DD